MAAYAFARLRWRGRNLIFSVLLSALMVPGILTFLPNFVLIKDLGLTNTFAGMILPGAFFSAFNIFFFLRQFMLGLSSEVEEAGRADRRRRADPGVLPDHPADVVGADHHAVAAHLHHRLERLFLAADGDERRQRTAVDARARCFQAVVTTGVARLVRTEPPP
nr:hypothetical protein [Fodinicola feengrottensis]